MAWTMCMPMFVKAERKIIYQQFILMSYLIQVIKGNLKGSSSPSHKGRKKFNNLIMVTSQNLSEKKKVSRGGRHVFFISHSESTHRYQFKWQ